MSDDLTAEQAAMIVLLSHFVEGRPQPRAELGRALEIVGRGRDWATLGRAFYRTALRVSLARLRAERADLLREAAAAGPRVTH